MKQLTITLLLAATTLFTQAQPGTILSTYKINADNEDFIKNESTYGVFGTEVENIGDLDNNGVDDLAVGTYDFGALDGMISIFFMNADGTIKTTTIIGEGIGGLDTDIPNDFEGFGNSITNMGDLDGDGVTDIATGNYSSTIKGEIFILYLNSDGTVKSHKRITTGLNGLSLSIDTKWRFSSSIEAIGDIDGDNIDDIAVGAPGKNNGQDEQGAIFILFMNSDETVKGFKEISSTSGGLNVNFDGFSRFGHSITRYDKSKIFVSAMSSNNGQGEIWLLEINSNGTVKDKHELAENMGGFQDTISESADFGSGLALAGDIDGDGINDIVVGAYDYYDLDEGTGAVFLLFMNEDGTVKSQKRYSNSVGDLGYTLNKDDWFGRSVTSMGDWNGDGKYDIAVGVPTEKYQGNPKGAVHLLFLDGKDQKVGVSNITTQSLSLYPNPANTSISINTNLFTNTNYTICVYDVTGRQVLNQIFTAAVKQPEVNIESLENGMYQVVITTSNQTYQGKFVVQH